MEEKLTATKYEILKEFRLSDWEFDTISKKHNIRSVKNFVDERGQFIALYEKQQVAEAIKANANKKILEWEACKSNPKLITRKELADLWKMPIIRVYDELKKRKIKPFKKTITDHGYNQYFYRKKDCGIAIERPEKKQDIRAEESAKSDKQKELEKWLNDDRYVQRKDLLKLWGLKPRGVAARISRKKLKPSKKFNNGKHGLIAFYSKAECISIENEFKYKNKTSPVLFNNQEYVPACGLELLWGISRSKVGRILRNSNIKGVKKSASSGYRMFYPRAECEAARPFIKEVKNEMEEQKLINTPIEDDFIPADTLDGYTLTALIAKLKEKGAIIENFKADLFDNHADEDIKRIGMLIRGSVKSVNLWGRQVDEVVSICGHIAANETTHNAAVLTKTDKEKQELFVKLLDSEFGQFKYGREILDNSYCRFTDTTVLFICKNERTMAMAAARQQELKDALCCAELDNYNIFVINEKTGVSANFESNHQKFVNNAKQSTAKTFRAAVQKLAADGLSIVEICNSLNISRTTFYKKLNEHPDLRVAIESGKCKAISDSTAGLSLNKMQVRVESLEKEVASLKSLNDRVAALEAGTPTAQNDNDSRIEPNKNKKVSDGIKPVNACPFCGFLSTVIVKPNKERLDYIVECLNCGARGPVNAVDQRTAILLWDLGDCGSRYKRPMIEPQ